MTLIIKKPSSPPCYRVERIKPLEERKYLWADSGLVLELFADTFGSSPSINLSHFLGEFHWSKYIIAICLEGHCLHDCIVVKYLHLGLLRRFDELHCAMCLAENKVYMATAQERYYCCYCYYVLSLNQLWWKQSCRIFNQQLIPMGLCLYILTQW